MTTPPPDPNGHVYNPPPAASPMPPYVGEPYPQAPAQPYGYGYRAVPAKPPGQTLGIVALIVVFFVTIVGLVLGIVAMSQSKAAGVDNTPAKIAVILGCVLVVLQIITVIIMFTFFGPWMWVYFS